MIPPSKKLRPVAAVIVRKGDTFLLVKKPRPDHAWQFPQGGVDASETHQQAAHRELAEECGDELKVKINEEPLGHYEYPFPADFVRHHGEYFGAKVTFFSAEYIRGEVKVDGQELVDSAWLTEKEIKELVSDSYWDNTNRFFKKKENIFWSFCKGILNFFEFITFMTIFGD